ncbi:hypothetical protein VTN77DRAFT_6978 [Rasamsonia byssochlamydoides]|uniref:uncharacterized protein n=1 Tax=Rasamsonia byssochlamydoides TaxID=89139 RepID=UPI003742B601
MFRPASRTLLRAPSRVAAPGRIRVVQRIPTTSRLISTAPPAQKSRSWTNCLVRLGLAVGVVYYYNTSSVFAEEPSFSLRPQPLEDENAPTIESLSAQRKQRLQSASVAVTEPQAQPSEGYTSPEDLEQEADQQGAFNPETGEINWDCPCLGGMAHGPCGEEFKAAFSCFVYSTEEPKGMDCIDKFKAMQDCFRQHPDVYGSELEEDEVDAQLEEHIAGTSEDEKASTAREVDASSTPAEKQAEAKEVAAQASQQQELSEGELVPKASLDAAEGKTHTKSTKTEK